MSPITNNLIKNLPYNNQSEFTIVMKIRKCTKRIPKNIKTFILICVILAVPCVNLNAKDSLGGVIYWHCDSGQNKIALTFDDGPNNPYTKKVLDILNFYNIKATFFLIGKYVEDFPEITQRIIDYHVPVTADIIAE